MGPFPAVTAFNCCLLSLSRISMRENKGGSSDPPSSGVGLLEFRCTVWSTSCCERNGCEAVRTFVWGWGCRLLSVETIHSAQNQENHEGNDNKIYYILNKVMVSYFGTANVDIQAREVS